MLTTPVLFMWGPWFETPVKFNRNLSLREVGRYESCGALFRSKSIHDPANLKPQFVFVAPHPSPLLTEKSNTTYVLHSWALHITPTRERTSEI